MSNGGVILEDLKPPVWKKEDELKLNIVTKQNKVLKYSLSNLLYLFIINDLS